MPSPTTILAVAYDTVCLLLLALALYRLALLCAWWRRPLPVEPPATDALPVVTVQLPIFNERFVARRILAAVAGLDYPRDRLEIQVLDDSTDRTAVLVRRVAAVLRRRGVEILVLRRSHREGFKAGALANGLRSARGELIAVFDADFIPPPDFLRRMLPHVLQPGVGVAQARWGHLDRDASWFSRLQAVLLDGHFAIEQPTRDAYGWLGTFNGTAGIWRREAILAAGGWSGDTLTEDLDLSLRAQLGGWRVRYVHDVVVPGELPASCNAFRAQQRRWTRGGVQVARKLLLRILRAPLPVVVKCEAALHLCSYAAYPLLVGLVLLRFPLHRWAADRSLFGLLPGGVLISELGLLIVGTLPLALFYWHAQRAAGVEGCKRRLWRDALPAMALGAGLALNNAIAVVAGLLGRPATFERTPKRGSRRDLRTTYPVRGTRFAWFECALLAYIVACKIASWEAPRAGELAFLGFFAFGLGALAMRTWDDTRREHVPAAS